MRFQCSFCSFIIEIEDKHKGRKIKCPSCDHHTIAPEAKFTETCVIGDFILEKKLGAGSLGTVYKANQISLDRVVALKILLPEYTNEKGIQDFLKEARAAGKLTHKNLVQSLAVGEENGICYMAMTYITGRTLIDRINKEGPIKPDESLHIIQQVAEALYYAWDEGQLIHRDVKPENIMITNEGIVKLMDLGLAMPQSEWSDEMEVSGSPSYMSPEQFAGEPLDPRSDIYSMGITLYQMLTAKLPFEATTVEDVAKQHFNDTPPSISKINPMIPNSVIAIVKKMIAKHIDDRYDDTDTLLKSIWSVRQKIAPNKDLIPDIHTISIKSLDYNVQEEMKERKQNKKIELYKQANSASKSKYKLFMFSFMVLFVSFIAYIVLSLGPSRKYNLISPRIQDLSDAINLGINDSDIAGYRDKLLSIEQLIPEDKSIEYQELRQRIQLIELNLQAKEFSKKIESNDQKNNNLRKEVNLYKTMAAYYKLKPYLKNKNNEKYKQALIVVKKLYILIQDNRQDVSLQRELKQYLK